MIELNPESEQTFGVHIMCKVLIELFTKGNSRDRFLLMLKCYRNQFSITNTVTE